MVRSAARATCADVRRRVYARFRCASSRLTSAGGVSFVGGRPVGAIVSYRGRRRRVDGFSPMSVSPAVAYLRDEATGQVESVQLPFDVREAA
jgi:hypothetical protein